MEDTSPKYNICSASLREENKDTNPFVKFWQLEGFRQSDDRLVVSDRDIDLTKFNI